MIKLQLRQYARAGIDFLQFLYLENGEGRKYGEMKNDSQKFSLLNQSRLQRVPVRIADLETAAI